MQEFFGRFKSGDAQKVATKSTSLVKEMRKRLLGSAVTPSEQEFLDPLIPKLSDTPENFMIKLDQLRRSPLAQLNSVRSTFGLPELGEDSLINKNERINLYAGVNKQGDSTQEQIQSYKTSLNPGEILVQDKQGNIGALPEGEFDPNNFIRL